MGRVTVVQTGAPPDPYGRLVAMRKMALVTGGGVVALLAHFAIVHALMSSDDMFGAFIAIGFGCALMGFAVGFVTKRIPMLVAMLLCAFVGTFFAAYQRGEQLELDAQLVPANIARDVAVDALREHPPGRVVYLRESYVRDDLVGGVEQRLKQGRGVVQYRVAPLVPADWTPADLVPAWAAFETNDSIIGGYSETDGLAEWAKASRAGFVMANDNLRFGESIADAEAKHGLRSAPDAPLLDWRSPEAERRDRRNRFWLALLATQAVWLLSTLDGWSARRKKAATTSA